MDTVMAATVLRSCCGASRWVTAMVAGRPYASFDALAAAADAAWRSTGPDDWHEAFAHHPRIGERRADGRTSARARAWSEREQASANTADAATRAALTRANQDYEARFGHIFLVNAAGKSAEDILAALRQRMTSDPERELAVAAEEQRNITQRRLRGLLDTGEASP